MCESASVRERVRVCERVRFEMEQVRVCVRVREHLCVSGDECGCEEN